MQATDSPPPTEWLDPWHDVQRRIAERWPDAQKEETVMISSSDSEEEDTEEPQRKKARGSDDEEDNLCVVCLERHATTMAWPCECVCVCQTCSDDLKHTLNAKVCIWCRKPITHVLDDPGVST